MTDIQQIPRVRAVVISTSSFNGYCSIKHGPMGDSVAPCCRLRVPLLCSRHSANATTGFVLAVAFAVWVFTVSPRHGIREEEPVIGSANASPHPLDVRLVIRHPAAEARGTWNSIVFVVSFHSLDPLFLNRHGSRTSLRSSSSASKRNCLRDRCSRWGSSLVISSQSQPIRRGRSLLDGTSVR